MRLYHNPHFLAYQDNHAQIPPPQRPVAFVALPDDLDLDPPALLNAAYSHTQHGYTQASWFNDPLVTPCLRSTSVGDLIGLPDGRLYVVERFGFRPYQPPADGVLQQLAAAYRQLDDARSGSQVAQQQAVEASLLAMSRFLSAAVSSLEPGEGFTPEPAGELDPELVAGLNPEPGERPVPWEKARPGDLIRGLTRPMRPTSVRKEKRRQGYLWYAYMRAHGQLYRRYVGKTAVLTQVKLDEVAAWLNEIW